MKKVYEPGEMFHAGCVIQNPAVGWPKWDRMEKRNKDVWAMREEIFLNLLSKQCEADEQTDDSSGMFIE